MNPFSHMFHPFSTSRFPSQAPLTLPPNVNSFMRNDHLANHGNLTVPGFQGIRLPEVTNASRVPPSLEEYNLPTKKVKHAQEIYPEVGKGKTANVPQIRSGMMSEEQISSKVGTKSPDESFGGYNQNVRKLANNFGFGGQDPSVFGGNPNMMEESRMMALNQLLKQLPKESATSNLGPFAPQNNGALSLLANNLAFGDMVSKNMYAANPQYLLDFMKQSDMQAKQAAMMAQIYQSMQLGSQLMQDYQETAGNNFKLNQSMANASKGQIPPFGHFPFPGRSMNQPNITLQTNPEFREKIEAKLSPGDAYKSSNIIQQGLLERRRFMEEPKVEYSVKVEAHRLEDQLTEEDQTQASSINIKEENDNNFAFNKLAAIKKKKPPQQRYSDFIYEQRKPIDERRKNKWQMKLDDFKEGGEGEQGLLNSQIQKYSQIKKLNKRLVAPKMKSEEFGEGEDQNSEQAIAKPQKTKKKGNKNRHKGNNKNANQKNPASTDENSYWNPTFIQSLIEKSNGATILSSFGKTNEELTLDENDQKTVKTKVSKDRQARICELDLGDDVFERRAPKLYWNPESFDEAELENYFTKLQATLGCTAINQDKAIKMLIKKNYIPEEVIVTIKKNEKFYSSFLGINQI